MLGGIPVVLLAAETAIRLQRLQNTTVSRVGGYALPSTDALEEFVAMTQPVTYGPRSSS